MNHWLIAPVVLPLFAGALLVLLEKARSRATAGVSLGSTLALLWVAAQLLLQAQTGDVQVYLVGNWQAPWGVALALDRLAALMVVLTALVGLAALVYALGGDDRKGIVSSLTRILAMRMVSIENMHTEIIISPGTGRRSFKVMAHLLVPAGLTNEQLHAELDGLASEMMLDVALGDRPRA